MPAAVNLEQSFRAVDLADYKSMQRLKQLAEATGDDHIIKYAERRMAELRERWKGKI